MSLLCVIPARGGSKRIPRKNIREFGGKPMIAWSIEAANASECFDHIIVSTDDIEIADVARQWAAEVPFMRPAELADDFASTNQVVAHCVQWYQDRGHELTAVCCLYATAPFVEPADIKQGLVLLDQAPIDRFVFTATDYPSPIQRALRLDLDSGMAHMWHPEQFSKRSQDLEDAYHDSGQFYWGRPQAWLQSENLFEGSKPLLLPRWRVHDIDTADDWKHAELMRQALAQEAR
ncbi:pseudaminic acid cytidylyltransferase [Cyanobium sp. Maggiore-St4-Cus]|uniref:pseudaminic acid cytidylyltransferase n=1 Tax=Cyanobium sp. Maggiore-St4-Cus TaxID=2823717 RepID=UPI0020CC1FE1|nr:pseudaminic acid cytidylyltransferase [Cyanobium sp. Maggiore-St4-Cus]MCP9787673.1 pseudaminic acid cytidylyltransferase [Cyanobium sp. Maggiore-St4-Cus]